MKTCLLYLRVYCTKYSDFLLLLLICYKWGENKYIYDKELTQNYEKNNHIKKLDFKMNNIKKCINNILFYVVYQ